MIRIDAVQITLLLYMYMLHLSIAILLDVGGRPKSLGLSLFNDSCPRPNIPFLRFVAFADPHKTIKASLVRSCPRRQESLRGLPCGIRNMNSRTHYKDYLGCSL
jgi:hypothetical protein